MADIEEHSRATEDKESETQVLSVEDNSLKGGRNRICKQCKFTCKDSREFSQHQLSAHGESEDSHCIQNSVSNNNNNSSNSSNTTGNNTYRRNSAKSCSPQIGNSKPDFFINSNNNNNIYKMSREEDDENSDHIYRDTEDDELEDRLIIAEDQDDSFSHTPIRSGNIQNRTYICPFCDFSSTSAKIFLHHQKDIHGKDFTIYECDVCDYATKYKQKLPRHRKLHFPGLEFNSSSVGVLGPITLTGENTQDTSDIIITSEVDIRKRDEEMEDELDDEDMEIVMEEGNGIDDSQKQKTKRTRQEVDPAKYIEVMDDVGIKYSCSKCGNIYKWRKSLNKHWKEKHADEKLDGIKQISSPHNPVKLGNTKITHEMNRKDSCEKLIYKKEGQSNGYADDGRVCHEISGVSDCVMPKMIGPFVTNSYISVYSTQNGQSSGQANSDQGVLDLSRKTPTSLSTNTQREPIDFSFKKEPYPSANVSGVMSIKAEPIWDNEQDMTEGGDDQKQTSPVLQCPRCSFVAKTFIDYSSHMAVHLNKRAFKCAECQQHFNCVEELNKHFAEVHVKKIHEHRDVIQKIPHGLQQTYHLLRMPLSSNEFNCTEQRQLKCSRCDFVAKWPAELQKHAVSHSEERPFICMVCGSTYKWKWDLVKHFEKSHSTLTNPYKRRATILGSNISEPTISRTADALVDSRSLDSIILPPKKKRRLSETDLTAIHSKYLDLEMRSDNFRFPRFSHSNRSSPLFFRERSSSVPPYLNNFPERIRYNERDSDDNSMPGLQITNVYSLVKDKTSSSQPDSLESSSLYTSSIQPTIERLTGCSDQFSSFEEQHKAVNAALRQRISMSSNRNKRLSSVNPNEKDRSCADILLPYKCTLCQYRARWPSEITQHMKNHSDEKPFCCPECSYKSKWKWDVVKHMKRCGGGTVKDVIDNSKMKFGPPNVVVTLREEPNDNEKMTKAPSNLLINGDANQFSFKPIIPGKIPPVIIDISDKVSTDVVDPPAKPPSVLDLRKESVSKPNPYFRDLINNGLYHCLECQFVGHSPAELKRHAYLHSEDKPYVCEVCTYSSRWKCDLKKHIRTYNHYGSGNGSQIDNIRKHSSPDVFGDVSVSEEPKVYKCNHCFFESDSKLALDQHTETHEKETVKHRCSKCNFVSDDSFIFSQHQLTHENTSTSSDPAAQPPVANTAKVSSRTRHLKNCRRPIKQYHCSKCPYVCLDDMDLVVHKEGHKPQGSNAFQCFFCDFSVHQKIQLINHLYLHPEFETSDKSKLNEILHYSQLLDVWQSNKDNEDMDLTCDDSLEYYSNSGNYDFNRGKKLDANDYKREETEMEEKENRFINGMSPMHDMSLKRLQCEWCEAAFAHISTLYQHARSVHPILLQQQEYENNIKYDDLPPPPPPPNYNGVAVSQNSAFNPILPKVTQTPKKVLPTQLTKPQKNLSPGKTGGPFKCQKCPFIGASSNTYSRHMERHGSNCKHTCLYCDYSIDRLNLLHQHMRGSHGHDVKQSPLNSSASDKTSPNGPHKQEMGSRVILSTPTYIQKSDGSSSESHLRPIAPKPVEGSHPEISPSLPILENGPNGKYMYRCPNCSFCSPKVANTSAHIRTHYISHNFADTKKYGEKVPELSYTPYLSDTTNKKFNNKLNNPMNARPLNCDCSDMSNLSKTHQPAKIPPKNMLLCLQCPFKTTTKESLQEHQEFHGYKGQYRCSECNFSVDHVNLFCDHSALHSASNYNSNQNPSNNDNNNNINSIGNNNNNNNNISSMNTSQINYRSNEGANNKTNSQKMGGDHFHPKYDNNERRGKLNLQQMLKQVKMAGRVRYKCSRCPYRTCCKNNIIKHRKQHIVNSRYKCQYCNYSAARKYLLQQHLKFHRDEASEQEKEFQDVVLDPYDENSVKTLKESSDYNKDLLTPKSFDNFNRRRKPSSGESTSVPVSLMIRANTERDGDEQSDMLEDEEKHLSDDQNYESKRRNFHCSLCPFSCNTAVVFQRHSQFHNSSLKYKCDFCNYSVDRFNLLTQHSRLHSQQTNYPPSASPEDMPVMDFSSPSSSFSSHNAYMNQKSSKDNTDRNINLSLLDEQAMGSEKFQMLEMGSEGNEEAMRYHCKLCPYMSNSLKSYNVHSSMHGCEGKYKCDYCDWSANRLNLLNQHRKVHSREPNFDPNPDELTFLNREALLQSTTDARSCNKLKNVDARHLINPKTKKCYSCKICPFSCNNKSSFFLHLGLHRNPARYKCSQCSYSVSRWNLLQQHERTHLSENEGCNSVDANGVQMNTKTNQGTLKARLRCPKCPYHCYAQHLLETHMKMHEPGERCVCNYCDYSTENWEALQKHMEIHNGITNLLCSTSKLDSSTLEQAAGDEECDNENSLRRKYSSENECEDGYRCDQCPFTTPSLDILQQHESQHEDIDDSTSCSYCQFTCRKESEMEKHMTTHHYDQTYNEEEEEKEEGNRLGRTENKSEEHAAELGCRVSETSQNNDDCVNTKLESRSSPTENELKINETGEGSPVEEEEEEDSNNLIDDSPTSAKSKLGSTSFECQYCDRGFDDETSMQEHEKHHYKAYDSIQQ
ncbi:uncharacterized protein LOC106879997 [Octopus bimaculoides]|uniref:C2H2-type domain-containing protein n=1 Tax=Octopus bimaculoides TaxID=37653 RepID=A0A0L8G0S6_OCTBM|nr:uncharacterized protein LOC106879997 [Octopus bimaculoides]XP_014785267.1 uncharacterized protein LOC106879997 [Octopus bimaculoides]XP_052826374.1 uncharacterized protein LOC106879997 [Octopus bimaculoides]XP_052826375.1 uncharacterized protein LOC106879997 [Octopus bimaculoides]XP_052826376.1 uncharacterized protein LOC106879997 [Octopus bimaculoides]XP_052826377.1 uncharacterized protein LOC106879997 [Octopus bimaculoides]XP_052826378.1 uncharacterized protein LOC106879997 [Octopus bima|eukprot:XP_014785266.1 PREDICTED: uncharacterized protein LOC106879997 [Octopus bimaculoides]